MASDHHEEHQRLVRSAGEHAAQIQAVMENAGGLFSEPMTRHMAGLRADLASLAIHGVQWEQDRNELIRTIEEAVEGRTLECEDCGATYPDPHARDCVNYPRAEEPIIDPDGWGTGYPGS